MKVFVNNESGIVWREEEMNLCKYYYDFFWDCRGEQEKPLRITGNRADICTWNFLNTKRRLDCDAWSEVKVSG
jgi:hypothetical protein